MEYGSQPTDWSKSPFDDTNKGQGRNLLLSSDAAVSSTAYNVKSYSFGDERPVEGEVYTLQIKGQLGADKVGWYAFNSGGTYGLYVLGGGYRNDNNATSPYTIWGDSFYDEKTGIYTAKIVWRAEGTTNSYLNLYALPNEATESPTTIEWVKLEKGTTPTPWSKAPEDEPVSEPRYTKYIENNGDKPAQLAVCVKKYNLLRNDGASTVINGVTFTVNENGTLTIDGTATANLNYYIQRTTLLPKGNYSVVFSGINVASGGIYVQSVTGANQPTYRLVTGMKGGITNVTDTEVGSVWLYVVNGTTFDNVTVSVMIMDTSIVHENYVPYTDNNVVIIDGAKQYSVDYGETTLPIILNGHEEKELIVEGEAYVQFSWKEGYL